MPELNKTILKNSANLKAYYRFESGALTTDSSGNGHTLTNQTAVGETTGVYGGGGAFNGSHYMYTANTTALNITGAITVGCWVNFNAVAEKGLVSKGLHGDATFQWALRTSSTGKLAFGVDDNGAWGPAGDAVGTTTPSTGVWYFVVGVYDGAAVRIYVNGKHETSTAYSSGIVSKTGNVYIGTFFDTSYLVNAVIDEVFIFSSALSADQIKELYEGRYLGELRPNQFGTTAGLWHLNGNSTDSSGNGNNGTDTAITYSQANGKFGQGAGFNGSTSKIVNTAFSASGTTFSYGCWFKTSNAAQQYIIEHYASSSADFTIQKYSDNKIYVGSWNGGSASSVITDGTYNDGVWHHLVVTRATTSVIIYIDGNAVKSGTGNNITVSTGFSIGRDNINNDSSFNGSIEEVFCTSTALTANQIRQIYALGVGKYY